MESDLEEKYKGGEQLQDKVKSAECIVDELKARADKNDRSLEMIDCEKESKIAEVEIKWR